jgi:two-component system, OmpR family, heavy metal sensor histidine kinase CusS
LIKDAVPRTLQARLTVLIILSTSAILALSGLALHEALRSRLESASTDLMSGTLATLQTHLAGSRNTEDIVSDAQTWIDLLHGHQNMALAVYDAAGQRLLGTPGFQSYEPVLAAPASRVPTNLTRAGSNLRYLVALVPLDDASGRSVRAAVQYDGTNDRVLLRAQAYTAVIIEVFGVILAAAFAYGIATLGLLPLRRLAAQAEAMSTSRLAQPLPELDATGELKELEHAFNDMRTPLTNLLAAAQVALSQPRTAEDYRDVIESSVDEYQRLSRMIEDMLFLARSEQADAALSLRSLDAAAEAERVAGYYEPMAEDAQVRIEVTGHGTVQADLLLFQRALSNLLSNALVQAPKGSTITIDCKEEPNSTTLTVSDSGPGIEAHHLKRIFERFYRVDPSRQCSASGTGLGLAIVKSIMNIHAGHCGCESRPHVCTRFWLRFPRRDCPANGASTPMTRGTVRKD